MIGHGAEMSDNIVLCNLIKFRLRSRKVNFRQ